MTDCSRPQAESSSRPLRRRAARIARPARVRMRSRKPCVFARRRLFGWNVRLLTWGLQDVSCGIYPRFGRQLTRRCHRWTSEPCHRGPGPGHPHGRSTVKSPHGTAGLIAGSNRVDGSGRRRRSTGTPGTHRTPPGTPEAGSVTVGQARPQRPNSAHHIGPDRLLSVLTSRIQSRHAEPGRTHRRTPRSAVAGGPCRPSPWDGAPAGSGYASESVSTRPHSSDTSRSQPVDNDVDAQRSHVHAAEDPL